MAILLLAALKTIPDSHYRAARMDGATSWEAFRYVTRARRSRNTLLVVGILSLILTLQTFDVLFTLTGGGPGQSTTVIIYYIYKSAIGTLSVRVRVGACRLPVRGDRACSSLLLLTRLRGRDRDLPDEDDATRPTTRGLLGGDPGAATVLATGRDAFEVTERRRTVRLPPWLGRLGFGIGVGLLVVWILGPIVWMAIAVRPA